MISRLIQAAIIVCCLLSSDLNAIQATTPISGDWRSWGYDLQNHRYNPGETRITPQTVDKLTLKWTFAFPNTMIASSQPTVVGDTVYVGGWNGYVYALDVDTGKERWNFFTGITGEIGVVRVGVVVTDDLVLFGDQKGRFYAVNKDNGTLAWINNQFETHPTAQITGSPVVYEDRVYVPMASHEEGAAIDASYQCCTFRGSLTALDLSTGAVVWRFYTVADEPIATGLRDTPFGPSGVGLWSTPAIDPDAKLIYLTTGNSYSPPVSPNSDAILAVNMDDGTLKWSTQLTPDDWFHAGCIEKPPVNCKGKHGEDYDFSSSPLLLTAGDQKLVIGIQKNGDMNALNALTGEKVWIQSVGQPVAINWGMAYDGKYIYSGDASFERNGTVYAIDPANGKIVWEADMPSCVPGLNVPVDQCWSGNMSAATATPGLVWIAAMDGQIHAFESETGKALWSYNTARVYKTTVNDVPGVGGSIAATGVTVANGMVFVTSGYSKWNASFLEGNVLLAFGLPDSVQN